MYRNFKVFSDLSQRCNAKRPGCSKSFKYSVRANLEMSRSKESQCKLQETWALRHIPISPYNIDPVQWSKIATEIISILFHFYLFGGDSLKEYISWLRMVEVGTHRLPGTSRNQVRAGPHLTINQSEPGWLKFRPLQLAQHTFGSFWGDELPSGELT